MKKRTVAIISAIAAVLFLGIGVLGYFSYAWINPKDGGAKINPGIIRGKILTDTGEMIMGNVIVEDEQGATKLYTTSILSGYEIALSAGTYKLHYTRGMQFSTVTKTVVVENFKRYYLEDVRLIRLYDAEQKNYYAGDLHQHTYFSDGSSGVSALLNADISGGLSWALLSDHNDNTGMSEWLQADRIPYDKRNGNYDFFTPIVGVEITTGFGHFQSIGSSAVVEQWDINIDKGDDPLTEVEIIAKEITRNGAIPQINHPYSTGSMGFNNYVGMWDLVDNFKTIEIWNGYFEPCGWVAQTPGKFNQNNQSKNKWFELLNQGKKIVATSGTDIHEINGSFNPGLYRDTVDEQYKKLLKQTGQYAGMPTMFLNLPAGKSTSAILNAIENGNGFLTNGPLLFADVNGKSYGETALLGNGNVSVNLEAFCRDNLKQLKVVKNGVEVKSLDMSGQNYNGSLTVENVSAGDYIVFELYGDGVMYAITNPIFF